MTNDHEIGRVVAVDTSQITIELNRDLKALARSTFEGPSEVGSINSYVVIPVGARRIVAMITRVMLTEETELKPEKTMVTLPSSKRLMKATMIGTIDEKKYRQGITLFPVLDTPVFLTTRNDLSSIFGVSSEERVDFEKPGYCISIGRSPVFPDYDIKIDPDSFFGKHAAVIGSTGSGKSCSIATILQSIMKHSQVKQTRFVILDTNGEYRSAFQKRSSESQWENASEKLKSLYIPTDPSEKEHLAIPYWFMNSEDFIRLFKAAPGVQQPVLLNALTAARNFSSGPSAFMHLRLVLIQECNKILAYCSGGDKADAKAIRQLCDGLIQLLGNNEVSALQKELCDSYSFLEESDLKEVFLAVKEIVREGIKDENGRFESYAIIDAEKRRRIEQKIQPLLGNLAILPENSSSLSVINSDCPSFFKKTEFRHRDLEAAISRDDTNSSRTRDACSTMLMRIYRYLEDSRFEFLFGPNDAEWPDVKNSLAAFIRDLLGLESAHKDPEEAFTAGSLLPFYDRQMNNAAGSNIVIVDLSLLASEVLENVTALIGRLIHEFLQRLGSPESGVGRGEFPVVLILEEAQNYIHENKKGDEESISKKVFERIAREGRKYGLGLVIASQRPSELSKTVLSQCNSFVVHRLQNPEDLRYFKEIVPGIFGQLLDQLPALSPGNALVLGECIQAPALVEMRRVDPPPKSRNPQFFRSWCSLAFYCVSKGRFFSRFLE